MNATRVLALQHRAIESLFDELEHDARRRSRVSAVSRLAEELIAHMAAEEAVFYPSVAQEVDDGPEAQDRGRQHRLMLRVELRRVLETSVADPFFAQRIRVLRDLFAHHVRQEEGDVFPRVAAAVSDVQLEALGAEVLASRPPVWIVTTEGRSLVDAGGHWSLRSSVSLPVPPPRD